MSETWYWIKFIAFLIIFLTNPLLFAMCLMVYQTDFLGYYIIFLSLEIGILLYVSIKAEDK